MRKKGRAAIMCILLGLALTSQAAVAHADTNHAPVKPQRNSRKQYVKRQEKEQKKARKLQNKTVKTWKKRHQA